MSLAGQLAQLVTVISSLASAGSVITECGAETLESRLNVTGLVLLYTQAISWFVNVGLLPEQPEGPHSPIPLTQLQAQYREELSRIIQLLSWDRTIVFRSFFKYQIFSVFSIQHIFKTRIYSVVGIRSNFTIRDNTGTGRRGGGWPGPGALTASPSCWLTFSAKTLGTISSRASRSPGAQGPIPRHLSTP